MFAKYTYKVGATVANILADVVLLATGTTDKALLSADCVQGSTEILSTIAAGWELYDAASGTNTKALRALNADGSTYKHMRIDMNTAGYLMTNVYESWNSTTHVGTNAANSSTSTSGQPIINTSLGGTLYISATSSFFLIQSLISGSLSNNAAGVVERTRDDAWDIVANGYPCYCFTNNLAAVYYPRAKSLGGDLTGSLAYMNSAVVGGTFNDLRKFLDAGGASFNGLVSIQLTGNVSGLSCLGGRVLGVFATTSSNGTTGDELVVSGTTYTIFALTSNARIAVFKG